MGFVFSKSMNENLKAQQEFMLMNSRLQVGSGSLSGADQPDKSGRLEGLKNYSEIRSQKVFKECFQTLAMEKLSVEITFYYSHSSHGPYTSNGHAREYISLGSWHLVSCTLLDVYATHLAKLGVPNQLERQLLMQNQMRERQTAMQIAWTREFLKYFGTFFGLAAIGLTAGAIKKKNPGVLLPIVPLSFIFAYQYDMGYGTLLQRIKGEAENILDTQSALLEPPKGSLTFEDLEKIRRSQSKFFIEK